MLTKKERDIRTYKELTWIIFGMAFISLFAAISLAIGDSYVTIIGWLFLGVILSGFGIAMMMIRQRIIDGRYH